MMHASRLTLFAIAFTLLAGCTNTRVAPPDPDAPALPSTESAPPTPPAPSAPGSSGLGPERVISPREAIVEAAERPDEGVTGLFAFEIKAAGRQDRHVFLNSEEDYRDQRCLTIAIRPAAAAELTERLGGDPVGLLKGKTVRVRGTAKRVKIRFYSNGLPTSSYYYQTQVFVDDLSQLEFEGMGTIRRFDLATLERLGNEMFVQDLAAARASDLMMEAMKSSPLDGLRGWIVSGNADQPLVRFFGERNGVLCALLDVDFGEIPSGKVKRQDAVPLEGAELEQARARILVASDVPDLPVLCAPRYNLICLPDPNGEGLLLWAVAAITKPGAVPVGGHYRYTVTEGGTKIAARDQLFKGCLTFDRDQLKVEGGATPVGFSMSWLVSDTPLEVHVFAQRYAGLPFSIITMDNDRIWMIEGGRIRPMN